MRTNFICCNFCERENVCDVIDRVNCIGLNDPNFIPDTDKVIQKAKKLGITCTDVLNLMKFVNRARD